MSTISYYEGRISDCENNLRIYEKEIMAIKETINLIAEALKNDNVDSLTLKKIAKFSAADFSSYEDGILDLNIDYSVDANNLTKTDTIVFEVKGKTYTATVYTSDKNDAVYVVADFAMSNSPQIRNMLLTNMKNHLSDGEMAIVTYNDSYNYSEDGKHKTINSFFQYDKGNKKNCTSRYDVVGKDEQGKMYAIKWQYSGGDHSELTCEDKGKSDTMMTSINGLAIANKMDIFMEEGVELHLSVKPNTSVQGGNQIVEEYKRLSFSDDQNQGVVTELDGEWNQYTNTRENREAGTAVSDASNYGSSNPTGNVLSVGNGRTREYDSKVSVGNVDTYVIPVVIKATKSSRKAVIMKGAVTYNFIDTEYPDYKYPDRANAPGKASWCYQGKTLSDWQL